MKKKEFIDSNEFINYKFILIDLFDTILLRDIPSYRIKLLWSKTIVQRLNLMINFDLLLHKRLEIEKEFYKNNKVIKYKDIMNSIYLYFKNNFYHDFSFFIALAEEIELQIELQYLAPNNTIMKLLDDLFVQNKILVLVTDYEHSTHFLHKLLFNFDLTKFFSNIYLSSEIGESKATGNIYKHIINKLNISIPSESIMIGNDKNSDYNNSKKYGFSSKLVFRKLKKDQIDVMYFLELLNKIPSIYNPLINYFAILTYIFITDLHFELVRNNLKHVVFLSREGEVLKALFDSYLGTIKNNEIQTFYFYTSRKAMILVGREKFQLNDFDKLLSEFKDLSIKEFLQALHFDSEIINFLGLKLLIDMNSKITTNNIVTIDAEQLFSSPIFNQHYESLCYLHSNNFKVYFESVIPRDETSIAIVDIGWKGTMQDSFTRIFKNKKKLYGYYFGITEKTTIYENSSKTGILFDYFSSNKSLYSLAKNDFSFFENVFFASHSSLNSYLTDGKLKFETKFDEEEKLIRTAIKPFQIILKDKVLALFNSPVLPLTTLEKNKVIFDSYERIIFDSSKSYLLLRKNILNNHSDNFGYNKKYSEVKKIKRYSKIPSLITLVLILKANGNSFLIKILHVIYKLQVLFKTYK